MEPIAVRLALVAALALVVVALGRARRARDGRLAASSDRLDAAALARLGIAGPGPVGVLLTSTTCSTCEAAKRVLTEVAADRPRFSWLEADVVDHLDVVRALRVLRAPTLLVVAPDGRIVARTSGVPRADELRRTIDATAPHTARRRTSARPTGRPGARAAEPARPARP